MLLLFHFFTPVMSFLIFFFILSKDAFGFFEEVQKKVVATLKDLCFDRDATLSVFVIGHQSIPCGNDFRHLIVQFVRNLLKSQRLVTMVREKLSFI